MNLLNTLPDRIFVISESGVFLDVFGGVSINSPYDIYKLVGCSLTDVLGEKLANDFLDTVNKAITSSQTQRHIYSSSPVEFSLGHEEIIKTKNQWYEGRVHPLKDLYNGEQAVVWNSRNITDSYELKQRLVELSEHDDLTSLLNRRSFFAKAQQCFNCLKRYGAQSSILMIDIDHFKLINDTKGHLFGDEVIKKVAEILKLEARESDSIGRLGGEEFSVILKMTSLNEAIVFAERVRKIIENYVFKFADDSIHSTISIGVSHINVSDCDYKMVFQRADEALYESKRQGRNKVTGWYDHDQTD